MAELIGSGALGTGSLGSDVVALGGHFMPPAKPIVSLANPIEGRPIENRLLSRFRAHDRSPNLYRLSDGTYTEIEPWDHQWMRLYLGGHITPITADEADALTAAGYGAGILP